MENIAIELVLSLLGVVLTFLATWFTKTYAGDKRLMQIAEYTDKVVFAAKQYQDGKTGAEKFAWASQMLKKKYPNLTDDEIRVLIESAYSMLKNVFNDA